MSLSSFRFSRSRFALILFVQLSFCGYICQAHAEKTSTEEWNISADKIIRLEVPKKTIVAQGNVILTKQEKQPPRLSQAEIESSSWSELLEEPLTKPKIQKKEIGPPIYKTTMTVKADWMAYDVDQESISAKGNVRIYTEDNELYATDGTLSLEKETGSFSNATILQKDNTLHLEGKKIEKTGPDTYRINDGWIITCKLENGQTPPWSFASSETNVRRDGFAVLKHARFNIRNVPVFYSPYLIVPVKNTRQTGFLFPEISTSNNNGFGINVPFFLNISESADATFYPKYLSNRGFMPGIEYRYVSSASDKGIFTADFLHDKLSDPSETDYYHDTGYTHDNSDRYWIRGKADYDYADWQTRLDLDIVSDQDYLTEFDSGITGFESSHNRYLNVFGRGFENQTDTQRENTLKTLRSWNGISLQASLLAINNADTNAPDTNTPLWQLPSIDYAGVVPIGESYFSFDWGANYVNYWREDGVGGQRIDFKPAISSPVPLGPYLESRAELSLRDTFYYVETYGDATWDKNNVQNRLYPEFEYEVATTLEKDFFFDSNGNRTYAHQIRPYVQYGYIPKVDQKDLPRFDDVDFIENQNLITYGIDNYINKYLNSGELGEDYNSILELKIEQSYDLRSDASGRPFSDIFSDFKWNPLTGTYLSYKTYYNVYDNKFDRHTLEAYYNDSRGDYLSLDYSYNEAANIEEINAYFLARLTGNWFAGGKIEHSISADETVEARGSLTYQTACWSVKFETRYTPDDIAYLVVFTLANIGFPLGLNF